MWSVTVMENWALSFDQCRLQVLQISVHLIDLLSILLRCNGFARIHKAVVDRRGSRPQNSDHDLFLVRVRLGKCFGAPSWSNNLVITGCHIKSTFCHMSQSNQEMVHCCIKKEKVMLQNDDFFFFLICSHFMRQPLIKLFHLSNLLQMPNNHRMVDIEFFGNFLCICKRMSSYDPLIWSLLTSKGQPLCSSSSRLWSPSKNFLNHHCTVCS